MSIRGPAPLIGLYSPAAQSGKTTLAQGMTGLGWQPMKFAGALRAMLAAVLSYQGLKDEAVTDFLDGHLKTAATPLLGGRTPRYAMRTLGTEWGREQMSQSLWVDLLLTRAAVARMQGLPVVVDDMRFVNEAQAIRQVGGVLVKIVRPGLAPEAGQHASEGGLDGWDFDKIVVNDASCATAFALDWAPRVSAFAYERAAASGLA